MVSPSIGDVFFRATVIAHESGASEIGIETLLAAIDAPTIAQTEPPDGSESGCYGFYINLEWVPLSAEAAKAIAPFGGFEHLSLDGLRAALLKKDEDGDS